MPVRPAQPLKQPVQARSRHTVEVILQAAIQVFEARGYAAGTTARIAERAGVSVGTLYQYFPNKDAVVAALAERHVAEVRALAESGAPAAAMPLPELIGHWVDAFLALHEANPVLHRLMSGGEFLLEASREQLERIRVDGAARLAALLAMRQDVRAGDPALMAYFVLQSLEHFSHTLVLYPPADVRRPQAVQELKTLLLRYLQK